MIGSRMLTLLYKHGNKLSFQIPLILLSIGLVLMYAATLASSVHLLWITQRYVQLLELTSTMATLLDLSNNRFAGKFPYVVLSLPKLIFLDIRFNEFEGNVPSELFDKPLDAIFINHNRFAFELPDNFGNSPVSVIVLASNRFHGCLPASIGNMSNLNEAILMNNGLRSCLPSEIGMLKNLTVFDVSFNQLMGPLPESFGGLAFTKECCSMQGLFV
ncbi:Leucine-rich repeat extensin-like protein 3 [Capsicum baccatum]|uniref:Leucine-rich repeat extensin-like protein 3 n=1 Tax=Capsicum baccatum TaxID=33114 RepID=A0A2G2UVJ2_CAPBA|nr:Leucine-rich repeat extensin-like protein 3 [Capsicum baccatum]